MEKVEFASLPVCRWRGQQTAPNHCICLSPKLTVLDPRGVSFQSCQQCYLRNHEPPLDTALPKWLVLTILGSQKLSGSHTFRFDGKMWRSASLIGDRQVDLVHSENRWQTQLDGQSLKGEATGFESPLWLTQEQVEDWEIGSSLTLIYSS